MVLLESKVSIKTDDNAPNFQLIGTDDQKHSLNDYKDYKGLLVIFMCNHCPYVKAKMEAIKEVHEKFKDTIALVGINSNDSVKYPDDSFESMKKIAQEKSLKFDYIVDEDQAKALEEKLKKATFDLDDFKDQLKQLKQMGPLNQIMGMMPGMNRKMLKGIDLDDRQLVWTEAIISSMTPSERKDPNIIDGSRRTRISKGSGRPVQEINQLLKQFAQMKKMMKKMGKMKLPKNLKNQMMGLN